MMIRKRFSRPLFVAAALAAGALVAGCGDDSSGSEEPEAVATPQEAIVQIGKVRAGLTAGLAAYAQGNAQKAEQLVGDAYLEHFELVEAPLEERDEELNEELEELISTEIRQEMKDGAQRAQVEALVEETQDELTRAEKALRSQ
jgi:hypothetical protein